MLFKLFLFTFAFAAIHCAPPGVEWYHFGMIADMDKKSISKSEKNTFNSDLKIDELRHDVKSDRYSYVMSRIKKPVTTKYGFNGRGGELSEVVVYNNRLYTFDDKTGITFRMTKDGELHPWVILANGDGNRSDGFKAEWATIKSNTIYVGSIGVIFKDKNGKPSPQSQWIKKISKDGTVTSEDWSAIYQKIRNAMKMPNGFVWHEAAMWSPLRKEWVFLPRKCSKDPISQENEEKTGCNKIITANENFKNIKVIDIKDTPRNPASGFSTFRFIPGTNNGRILALRTVEKDDLIETSAVVIDMSGKVLMSEKKLYNDKYEGLAFFGGVRRNKS
uniref:Putative apyrase n=1 Tax=Nyssomyia neivai TaxID=330878 RepID=A0A1L8DQB5_9DIPT